MHLFWFYPKLTTTSQFIRLKLWVQIPLFCNILQYFAWYSPICKSTVDACGSRYIQAVQNVCWRFALCVSLITLLKIVNIKYASYPSRKKSFRTDAHHLNIQNKVVITLPLRRTVLFEKSFSYISYISKPVSITVPSLPPSILKLIIGPYCL